MRRLFRGQGFTNRLLVINWIVAIILTEQCFVFTAIFSQSDFSTIASVTIPAVWAEVGVFSGFTVWKTKAENLVKIGQKNPDLNISM